jgi:hypothetical protein
MSRTVVLQGVRMMKFRDVFGRCEEGSLSKLEAAELLGANERTFEGIRMMAINRSMERRRGSGERRL